MIMSQFDFGFQPKLCLAISAKKGGDSMRFYAKQHPKKQGQRACLKTLHSPFDKLRVIGTGTESVDILPFVVSLSNHKKDFFNGPTDTIILTIQETGGRVKKERDISVCPYLSIINRRKFHVNKKSIGFRSSYSNSNLGSLTPFSTFTLRQAQGNRNRH